MMRTDCDFLAVGPQPVTLEMLDELEILGSFLDAEHVVHPVNS
jgi:hypothetical protein